LENTTVKALLAERQASLIDRAITEAEIVARLHLSKRIAAAYEIFEPLRDGLLGRGNVAITAITRPILSMMEDLDLADRRSGEWLAAGAEARRYLSGGWLEEYIAGAVSDAGADEVYCGQKITWLASGFQGENEIDVLARFGERLFFCSCKALKHRLDSQDQRTRERLMDALHEADNLADHFGPSGSIVALAVTTDLVNERDGWVRYEPLHGKAAVLGVHLLSAEKLHWPVLLKQITAMLQL
jgi:Domain of unknown function (DUF1887)